MRVKNQAAVDLGRLGGRARAKKMTEEQRKLSAQKAAQSRWGKKTPQNPKAQLKPLATSSTSQQ